VADCAGVAPSMRTVIVSENEPTVLPQHRGPVPVSENQAAEDAVRDNGGLLPRSTALPKAAVNVRLALVRSRVCRTAIQEHREAPWK